MCQLAEGDVTALADVGQDGLDRGDGLVATRVGLRQEVARVAGATAQVDAVQEGHGPPTLPGGPSPARTGWPRAGTRRRAWRSTDRSGWTRLGCGTRRRSRESGPMPDDAAELTSVASQLDGLTQRVTAAADRAQAAGEESLAADLYEIERALRAGTRRLGAVVRRLDD